MEKIKFIPVKKDSIVKWKIFTHHWWFWIFLDNWQKWIYRLCGLWTYSWSSSTRNDGNLHYIDDSSLVVIENSLWQKISIDEMAFNADFYSVNIGSTIPNLKKICADFHSEEQKRLNDTSIDVILDELTDYEESTSETSSTPSVTSPETTAQESPSEILSRLERCLTPTRNDIKQLLRISLRELTSHQHWLLQNILATAHWQCESPTLRDVMSRMYYQSSSQQRSLMNLQQSEQPPQPTYRRPSIR